VRRATNQAGDHETDDVTDTVGAALVRQGAAAAAIVGVRLAGVDVITTDPRVSLDESRGVILEVNTTPGLHLHVLVRNPQLPGVAARILDRLLGPGAHA
jgi:cyanophycin synthetase